MPVHHLLDPERAGPAAFAARALGDAVLRYLGWGTVLVFLPALLLGHVLPAERVRGRLSRIGDLLLRPSVFQWTVLVMSVAIVTAASVALGPFQATPTLLDEMTQLLHARYLAAGSLAGPLQDPTAARIIQNSILTSDGWASIYPPGHTALLALGHLLGAPWVVGPAAFGVLAAATYVSVRALSMDRPVVGRVTSLLVAASPFLVALGAGYLSHVTAAAAGASALYFALRARDGSWSWGIALGAAAGLTVTSRPWIGLVLGVVLPTSVLAVEGWARRDARWLASRLGSATAAGLPFAVAFGWFNARLFGAPLQLGYGAAFGEGHGLGFHRDPWGNLYGPIEALGYTGADLLALGKDLLETPVSLVALVGLFLVLVPRLAPGVRILLGWALLPVAANALYWHHGYHFGPRMLYEAAPAWLALAVMAAMTLTEPGPAGGGRWGRVRRASASVLLWMILLSAPMAAWILPREVGSWSWSEAQLAERRPPPPGPDTPALVFVHGTWSSRIASRLVQAGMRRDSIETALRRNDICRVHAYAQARLAGESPLPPLDLDALPGSPPGLGIVQITPGNPIRVAPGRELPPDCVREARSDRLGVIELAPLLWQSGLPGWGEEVLLFRDLGPETNQTLLGRYPERVPYVWVTPDPEQPPSLMSYEQGMELLWGGQARRGGGRVSGRDGPVGGDAGVGDRRTAGAAPPDVSGRPGPR